MSSELDDFRAAAESLKTYAETCTVSSTNALAELEMESIENLASQDGLIPLESLASLGWDLHQKALSDAFGSLR